MCSLIEIIRSKTSIEKDNLKDDEYYYDDYTIFDECPLCNKTNNNDESYFTYVSKYPHPNISDCCVYMNIKLQMCYDCLRLGLHYYYLQYKSFPKLRRDGYIFHNTLIYTTKQKIEAEIGYPQYGVPKVYKCDFYNIYNKDIVSQLYNRYHT